MNEYLSRKITVLNMLCIFGTVVIHLHHSDAEGYWFAGVLQRSVGGYFWRFGVPLLFMMSGYLFFRNVESIFQIGRKLRTRIRSLVVPYVLRCLISFAFYAYMAVPPYSVVLERGFFGALIGIFVEPLHSTYHLWFLRYLMGFMLLTPVLWISLCRRWSAYAVLFAIILVCLYGDWLSYYARMFMYFAMGAVLARSGVNVAERVPCIVAAFSGVLYVGLCVLGMWCPSGPAMTMLRILVGCVFVWSAYDVVDWSAKWGKFICSIAAYSFFVYLFHEPWMHTYQRFVLKYTGGGEWSHLFTYSIVPFMTCGTCILVAMLLHKWAKPVYYVLSGGRLPRTM